MCLFNVSKQLNIIKAVFETESLLAMTDSFTSYCERIIDFVFAEKFYMFTCIHMLKISNHKIFYRERSFKSMLRLFYFLAELRIAIEERRFSNSRDLNMESIKEL